MSPCRGQMPPPSRGPRPIGITSSSNSIRTQRAVEAGNGHQPQGDDAQACYGEVYPIDAYVEINRTSDNRKVGSVSLNGQVQGGVVHPQRIFIPFEELGLYDLPGTSDTELSVRISVDVSGFGRAREFTVSMGPRPERAMRMSRSEGYESNPLPFATNSTVPRRS